MHKRKKEMATKERAKIKFLSSGHERLSNTERCWVGHGTTGIYNDIIQSLRVDVLA